MDKNGILINLSESDKTAFGKEDFEAQSFPQKVFSAIWALESEVNNGGFSQYFLNSSCETAGFVVTALETVDAPKTTDICRRAIAAAFPSGLPASPEEISVAAENFSGEVEDKLGELDATSTSILMTSQSYCLPLSPRILVSLARFENQMTHS